MTAPASRAARLGLIKQHDTTFIAQGLKLLPIRMDTPNARAQMLKIGLQEGRLFYRDQLERNGTNTVLGPALSVYQFERGGVAGLMRHSATRDHLRAVCRAKSVPYAKEAIWKRMAIDDVFAAALCRLNLWWHSRPLPDMSDCWGTWGYYLDCWNPGKPHPETWPGFHEEVLEYFSTKL